MAFFKFSLRGRSLLESLNREAGLNRAFKVNKIKPTYEKLHVKRNDYS